MNNNNNKDGYVSIFEQAKAKNKKKNKQPLIENRGLVKKKKVKLDQQHNEKVVERSDVPEDEFSGVELALNSSMNLQKLFSIQALQKLLLWVLAKDQLNPMWFFLNNKAALKCVVVISVSRLEASVYEEFIEKNKDCYLARYTNSNHYTRFKSGPFMLTNEEFWLSFLSTQTKDIRAIQEKPARKVNYTGKVQEEVVWDRFEANILSSDELELNLYPSKKSELCSEYIEIPLQKGANPGQDLLTTTASKLLAVDCEMVKTEFGLELARISIVDYNFQTIYDTFVKPDNEILDYNTRYSGILPEHLADCDVKLKNVQQHLQNTISHEAILIGHSLENDLRALQMIHERIIDTSVLFQSHKGFKNSLKTLAHNYLHLDIQKGTHNSIEDAKTTLALAKLKIEVLDNFENIISQKPKSLDLLESVLKNGKGVLPLDDTENLKTTLRYGTTLDELKTNTCDEILIKIKKWLKLKNTVGTKAPNLIIARVRELEAFRIGQPKKTDSKEEREEGEYTAEEIQEFTQKLIDKISKGIADFESENKQDIAYIVTSEGSAPTLKTDKP